MASRNLTRLNVALTATIGPFASAFKGATGIAERFGSSLKGALLSPITAITSALSAGAFLAGIKSAASRIDELAKAADRLGVTTQSLAGLQHAAELSGASAEQLQSGMERLTKTVQDAANGSNAAKDALQGIGLSVSELAALSPDQQFARVADAINGLDTAGKKTAATMELFGKGNTELINVLALGSKGLADMTTEAEKLGIAVSRVDAVKVEEANDALSNVGEVIKGIFDKIAVRLAPFVTAIANSFVGSAVEAEGFGSTIDRVMNFAVKAGGFVADAWQGLTIVWNALMVATGWVGAALVNMGDTAIRIAEWIGTKFIQSWDVIKANATLLGSALGVIWAEMQIPIAQFVQFVGQQLSALLNNMSTAVRRLSPDMADSLAAAAGTISSSTGDSVARAQKNLDQWKASVVQATEADKQAWTALFSDVETKGSETLQNLTVQLIQFANEHQANIQEIGKNGPASEQFESLVAQIQAEADQRAQARAAELDAMRQQQADAAAIEADSLAAREEQQTSYWQRIAEFAGNAQTRTVVSGFSAMFANLEKLQQSHSKRARTLGKAAAKAKIVTDTASAAMGAYSAMASIPFVGPALGIAAAAAAVAAGAIQLGNVDKADSGSLGNTPDKSVDNIGGIAAPRQNTQSLILQGDSFSAESMVKIFDEARERGIVIDRVRRG